MFGVIGGGWESAMTELLRGRGYGNGYTGYAIIMVAGIGAGLPILRWQG